MFLHKKNLPKRYIWRIERMLTYFLDASYNIRFSTKLKKICLTGSIRNKPEKPGRRVLNEGRRVFDFQLVLIIEFMKMSISRIEVEYQHV